MVNRIQNLRKESNFEITDRITILVSPNEASNDAIQDFSDYIKSQVLANSISIEENNGVETDFDTYRLNIKIQKV